MNEAAKEPRLSLGVSIRRYWPYLLGYALFPPCSAIAQYLHCPFWVMAIAFIGIVGLGAWPYWRKRAPSSFGFVGWVVWGGSILLLYFALKIIWWISN